jgi:hypothetical protein
MTLPLPVPVGLSAPVGLPANAPRTRAPKPADDDEVNVELVTLPQSAPASNQFPVGPPVIVRAPDERPLTEFHRRDMIMLGIGGFGVLTAFGLGFGLAQLIRKKPTDDEAKEEGK